MASRKGSHAEGVEIQCSDLDPLNSTPNPVVTSLAAFEVLVFPLAEWVWGLGLLLGLGAAECTPNPVVTSLFECIGDMRKGSPRGRIAETGSSQPTQKPQKQENPMNVSHYIGFDVYKKTINYCVKTADGQIVEEGRLLAVRPKLREWARTRQYQWQGAMEATLFSAWIYDTLKPYAEQLLMGHPARMKAICAGKKKTDRLDARTIADLLRCNLLPTCYVVSADLRDLRRLLCYRQLVVRQSVRMKNKVAGLLMETGTPFVKDCMASSTLPL
jgi:Transposase